MLSPVRPTGFTIALPATLLTASVVVLSLVSPAERALLVPICIMSNIMVLFLAVLWFRDGELPAFELGTLCIVTTTLYSVSPLLGFLLAGQKWTIFSDTRLYVHQPNAVEMGRFAMYHVAYLSCLAGSYLIVRGHASTRASVRLPDRSSLVVLIAAVVAVSIGLNLLGALYGVAYGSSYADIRARGDLTERLPYLLRQISHNVAAMGLVAKLCLVTLLVTKWQKPRWRIVLLGWLFAEVVFVAVRMGARTEAALLLVAAALLYHRFVRPWSFAGAVAATVVGLGGILAYGIARDFNTALQGLDSFGISPWSINNEFQAIYGTSYDLYLRRIVGSLPTAPWQVYLSDVLLPIPQQLVPFDKIDPAQWYLRIATLDGRGFGAMFGVIAQGVIGFGFAEVMARGVVLGTLFACVHRAYVARAESFWITILYLYICLWSYYTFRSTTFYFVYPVIYAFVPTYLVVRIGAELVRGATTMPRHTRVGSRPVALTS